ncbi:MAG: hypothetical protein HUU50_03070 [Candidatus Brocadiae bacterium]|nr:hypothetical protein [Candidatus Brocadiia bacterium]
MRFFLIGLFFFSFIIASADGIEKQELEKCKIFFATMARLSRENLPQYKNAVSPSFRACVLKNEKILALIDKKDRYVNEKETLKRILGEFYSGIYLDSFEENLDYSSTLKDRNRIFWGNFIALLPWINKSVEALSPLLTSSQKEEILKNVTNSSLNFYAFVSQQKIATKGIYANGHIARYTHNNAKDALAQLNTYFPDSNDGFILALKNSLGLILSLEVEGYDPWLSPWWQLRFQIICQVWEY